MKKFEVGKKYRATALTNGHPFAKNEYTLEVVNIIKGTLYSICNPLTIMNLAEIEVLHNDLEFVTFKDERWNTQWICYSVDEIKEK